MEGRSPPRLIIPTSSVSPSGQSVNTQTGRPTMWTPSALRKMIRLYLYTDLQLTQIVKIVHHCESSGQAPGKDSANKKLNAMLDQQPRWLRPTSSNMAERLEELSNSPTRATPSPTSAFSRPHSTSDPSPYANRAPFFKAEATTPSPFALSPQSALTPDFVGRDYGYSPAIGGEEPDMSYRDFQEQSENLAAGEQALLNFVRKTTFMSSSTDHTTGSFQELLGDRSQPYVQAVRRLVKRFTIPVSSILNMSPVSEDNDGPSTWFNERDCPTDYIDGPSPLPGDFIRQDFYAGTQTCLPLSDFHLKRRCLCAARADLPARPSLWVSPTGLTPRAQRLMTHEPREEDISLRDACGNTLLHFIAASDVSRLLGRLLLSGQCDRILNTKNTAGQSFMHLVGAAFLEHVEMHAFFQLLLEKRFDIAAKDHYGRTVFHMLLIHGVPSQNVHMLLEHYGLPGCDDRDAFGVIPSLSFGNDISAAYLDTEAMVLDDPFAVSASDLGQGVAAEEGRWAESHIIEDVREAQKSPKWENSRGSNGLHSLATATLSLRSALDRNNMFLRATPERGARRGDRTPDQELDSSNSKMQLRHELAEGLLMAGVNPNHYDKDGCTPLMAFAAELPEDDDYKTGPNILTLLCKYGANVNARNRRGETALHVSVRCGRKLAVRTLQTLHANVNARDADGRSALEVADVKIKGNKDGDPKAYAHFEACRAWLSGKGAVQEPTVVQEWGCT